jgi:hypothetical protein
MTRYSLCIHFTDAFQEILLSDETEAKSTASKLLFCLMKNCRGVEDITLWEQTLDEHGDKVLDETRLDF